MRLATLFACALLLVAPAQSQKIGQSGMPPAGPLKPFRLPTLTETKLPNGLTVVFAEDDRFPLTTVQLVFGGGTKRDPSDTPGTTAALAATLLRGTGTRSARQFTEDLAGIGFVMSATALPDSISIEASGMAETTGNVLLLLADVLRDAQIPESELDLYRRSRKQSLPAETTQPALVASRLLRNTVLGKAYGDPELTPDAVDLLDRQTVLEYRSAWFIPNNAYLILTGKLPPRADLTKVVTALFGAWGTGKIPAAAPVKQPEARRRLLIVDRPGAPQAEIRVAWPGPAFASPDLLPLNLASDIVGGSPRSRLALDLREVLNPGEDVHTEVTGLAEGGMIAASARVRAAVATDILTKILAQIDRIAKEPVGTAELSAARSSLAGTFILGLESQRRLSQELAQMTLLNLPKDYLETYPARVNGITSELISEVAKKWMAADRATIIVVGDAAKIRPSLEKAFGKFETVSTYENH